MIRYTITDFDGDKALRVEFPDYPGRWATLELGQDGKTPTTLADVERLIAQYVPHQEVVDAQAAIGSLLRSQVADIVGAARTIERFTRDQTPRLTPAEQAALIAAREAEEEARITAIVTRVVGARTP